MRRITKYSLLAALMLVPVLAFGQLKEQESQPHFSQVLRSNPLSARGLAGWLGLNPARFSMQQSYSLSYLSFGGKGFSQGVYLNTMQYQFADPLTVQLQWGVAHQPFVGAGLPGIYGNGVFLSGASVDYKPSEKISIGLRLESYPPGGLSPNAYDYRLRERQ